MNDNYIEDDEIFEQEESEATDTEESSNGSGKTLRIILIAVVVALVVVIVAVSVLLNAKKDDDENETISENTASTTISDSSAGNDESTSAIIGEQTTYEPGKYTVNVGQNGTLTLRKSPSKTAESILSIPNGTSLTITEIYTDTAATDDLVYWGKTVYLGWDAWVSMNYLAKAYSDNIVTPAEVTTEPSSSEAEASSDTSTEVIATEEKTTEAQQENSGEASNVYVVNVDGGLTLNMRSEPNADSEKVHSSGIPSGTEVTVLDTYENADAVDANVKVWAKVTYDGVTGWVAMGYLESKN